MNMFKKNGGFTLVELIVVIAILAILATVAVPAYSGYVKKANKAADEAEVVVVNQAIGAACAMNGMNASVVTSITFANDGKAATEIKVNNTANADVLADFNAFFAGNVFLIDANADYEATFTNGQYTLTDKTE